MNFRAIHLGTFAGALLALVGCASKGSAQTTYIGVVATAGSGQVIGHVRVDTKYTPLSFSFVGHPDITLASTYTNDNGAFSLTVPSSAGHKPSDLAALKFEKGDTIRIDGRLNRPKEYQSNTIAATSSPWISPHKLLKAVGIDQANVNAGRGHTDPEPSTTK